MSAPLRSFLDGRVTLWQGDCHEVLRDLADNSVDSVVTDPPYELNFMGRKWDNTGITNDPKLWAEVLRVLKPGGYILAFSSSRTYHRTACAIEDAGFITHPMVGWVFGSGFPKAHSVSKHIDRIAGAEREVVVDRTLNNNRFAVSGRGIEQEQFRKQQGNASITAPATEAAQQWDGWYYGGQALKPALEPVYMGQKPFSENNGTANVLKWGTGAINVDRCRIESIDDYIDNRVTQGINTAQTSYEWRQERRKFEPATNGRWPANLCHDGSEEVVAAFPETKSGQLLPRHSCDNEKRKIYGDFHNNHPTAEFGGDSGSAARFFYSAKADAHDRAGSRHPTVKPLDLMQWLVRLVTPPDGIVLDPFAGTGTTAEACFREGMRCILIEREAESIADIERRMKLCLAGPDERSRESIKALGRVADPGPLFGGGHV